MGLVVEHHEALEVDLRGQGIDLLDFWRGRLSPRALDVAVRHLPITSRFWSSADPDAAMVASWDNADYQRALLIDLIGKANFENWKPLPRPGEIVERQRREAQREAALIAQRDRQLARQRSRA